MIQIRLVAAALKKIMTPEAIFDADLLPLLNIEIAAAENVQVRQGVGTDGQPGAERIESLGSGRVNLKRLHAQGSRPQPGELRRQQPHAADESRSGR